MSISLRHHKVNLAKATAAYTCWGPMVLRFCELFLGDDRMAEQATTEVFVRFFRSGCVAEANGTPVALLSCAFLVASQSSPANAECSESLEAAALRLDPMARAVFILHGVMSVQLPWVAAILGLSPEETTVLWARALCGIRERLPEDFFKEQRR